MKYTPEQFIKFYMEAFRLGEKQSDLAKRIGMNRGSIENRVIYMRKRGVKLPNLPTIHIGEPYNIEALNKLIEKELDGPPPNSPPEDSLKM